MVMAVAFGSKKAMIMMLLTSIYIAKKTKQKKPQDDKNMTNSEQ
jgi:hypothetical protein